MARAALLVFLIVTVAIPALGKVHWSWSQESKDFARTIFERSGYKHQPQISQESRLRAAERFFCSNNGMYENPGECTTYIQCINEIGYRMTCDSGLHFSRKTKKCESPCDAHCDPYLSQRCGWRGAAQYSQDVDVCTLSPESGPCFSYLPSYYFDSADRVCRRFIYGGCEGNGNRFDTLPECEARCLSGDLKKSPWISPQTRLVSQDHFACVEDGVYKNPKDCRSYIQCFNGLAYEQICDPGTHFSEQYQSCKGPCEAYCDEGIAKTCGWEDRDSPEATVARRCRVLPQQEDCDYAAGGCRTYFYGGCGRYHIYTSMEDCEYSCSMKDSNFQKTPWSSSPERLRSNVDFDCLMDGRHSNPDDCKTYIQCSNGLPYEQPCRPGTHFSIKDQTCVSPCDAHCDKTMAEICGWEDRKSLEGFSNMFGFSQDSPSRRLRVRSFTCIKDGWYQNPDDCKTYIQCSNGLAYEQTCPAGLHFSVEDKGCESPCDAHCDDSLAEECGWEYSTTFEVPDRKSLGTPTEYSPIAQAFICMLDGDYSIPEDCTTFIQCSDGLPSVQPCPTGFHFSEETERCETPCDAQCDISLVEQCGWDKERSASVSLSENICRLAPEKGPCDALRTRWYFDSGRGECREFMYSGCRGNANNFRTKKDCEISCLRRQSSDRTSFEISSDSPIAENFTCVKDGVYQNPEDCSTFIQCSNDLPYVQNCPAGLHFSQEIESCESRCDARCDESLVDECNWTTADLADFRRIPANKSLPDDITCIVDRLYQNTDDCSNYIQCANGLPYIQPCPSGLHFSEMTQKCESPCDARCDQSLANECGWDVESRTIGICYMHAEKGPCNGSLKRYYYDFNAGRCKKFEYGGCKGNGNNFETLEDCQNRCPDSEVMPTENEWGISRSNPEDRAEFYTEEYIDMSSKFTCFTDGLYPDPQDCERFVQCVNGLAHGIPCPRGLHFSETSRSCVPQCDAYCNMTAACQCGWPECSEIDVDCEADPLTGPCKASISRFYYDRGSGRCKRFNYGGCGGNTNNFLTRHECTEKCQKELLGGYRCPSYSGKFANFFDCNSYYDCKRGNPILKGCSKGMAFDHIKAKCVYEPDARCLLFRCREPDAMYPYTLDCHKYIDCVNGIAKVQKCPPSQAFDSVILNCVDQKTVRCAGI